MLLKSVPIINEVTNRKESGWPSRYSDGLQYERSGFFFSPQCLWSSQPPIQWVPGALSSGVKRQGREADHSPPTSAEVKKISIYTSTPPYAFMA
jgi:hypothetical protein